MKLHSYLSLVGLFVLALLTTGCGGDGVKRLELAGKATFGGEPIVFGTIEFVPDKDRGHSGPAGYARIEDGLYDTRNDGQGVIQGAYKVIVTAYSAKLETTDTETMENPPDPPAPMFRNYTLELDLQSSEQNIEVPAEAQGHGLTGAGAPRRGANEP
jgi:hypothetical protein